MACVFLEGDKACEGGDERSRAADVYTDKEVCIVFGKLRKKNCRGNVAYKLTGNDTCNKNVFTVCTYNAFNEVSDNVNSCNVTGENKEYTTSYINKWLNSSEEEYSGVLEKHLNNIDKYLQPTNTCLDKVNILGVKVDKVNIEDASDIIINHIKHRKKVCIFYMFVFSNFFLVKFLEYAFCFKSSSEFKYFSAKLWCLTGFGIGPFLEIKFKCLSLSLIELIVL